MREFRRIAGGPTWLVLCVLLLGAVAGTVFLAPLAECPACIPGVFVFTRDGVTPGSRVAGGLPLCWRCGGRGRISPFSAWREDRS